MCGMGAPSDDALAMSTGQQDRSPLGSAAECRTEMESCPVGGCRLVAAGQTR